jgi:hypothetical protein
MKAELELEDHGMPITSVDFELFPSETIDTLAARLALQIQMEPDDIIAGLCMDGAPIPNEIALQEHLMRGHRLRLKRVCIDLHFETEAAMHKFPPHATWGRVLDWGCNHFRVPRDLRANLELREGSPTGPAVNERLEIGEFGGCKTVWLVKPGPEPNGECA